MPHRERPLLVYDGDCAFCQSCVRFIERRIRTRAEISAFQFTDLAAVGATVERAAHEVLWVARDGKISGGAAAVAELLRDAGGAWRFLGSVIRIAPFRWAAHGVYRLVARNRRRLPGGTAACVLPADRRPGAVGRR